MQEVLNEEEEERSMEQDYKRPASTSTSKSCTHAIIYTMQQMLTFLQFLLLMDIFCMTPKKNNSSVSCLCTSQRNTKFAHSQYDANDASSNQSVTDGNEKCPLIDILHLHIHCCAVDSEYYRNVQIWAAMRINLHVNP